MDSEDREFIKLTSKMWNESGMDDYIDPQDNDLHRKWFEAWRDLERFEIKEYKDPDSLNLINAVRKLTVHDPFNFEDDSELHFWWCGFGDWATAMKRYFELIPPYIRYGNKIPQPIRKLYAESRWCFIYGQYNACLTVNRAIIDAIIKEKKPVFLIAKKYEQNFKKKNPYSTGEFLIEFMKNSHITKDLQKDTYKFIVKIANDILHKAKSIGKDECLKALEIMNQFFEEIYKSRPTN